MRRILVSFIVIGIVEILASTAIAASTPFTGAWEATDDDGSHLTLTIGGHGTTVSVKLFDDSASACLNAGAPSGAATVPGTGTIDGSTLVSSFDHIRCTGGIAIETPGGTQTYEHDAVTDTLALDFDGDADADITWYRINSAEA